ncbi:MAG: hypothetical protein ACLT4C_09125 [Butyricicoccus sp.]
MRENALELHGVCKKYGGFALRIYPAEHGNGLRTVPERQRPSRRCSTSSGRQR